MHNVTFPTPKAEPSPAVRGGAAWLSGAVTRFVVAVILALTLWLGLWDATELSTDEAQYWAFGQHLAFGNYSKPPLTGWIIRVATDLLGDTVWAVRLPAALIHGATALVVLSFGRRLVAPDIAAMAAVIYLTTSAVALGLALMTTDTPLLLAAAPALRLQGELALKSQGSAALALGLGLAVGIGVMAKYAMVYAVAGMALAALLSPRWRIWGRNLALAAGVAVLVVLPHVLWLAGHGFVTFFHLSQTSGLPDEPAVWRPDLVGAARFGVEQLAVMGPVVLIALLVGLAQARRGTEQIGLAAMAAVPLLIVMGQAVAGKALANWAVVRLIPASVVAACVLIRHPRLFALSLALGLSVSVALPLAKVAGAALRLPNGQPALKRYLGHGELMAWVHAQARAGGALVIVAEDRDILADLEWFTLPGGPLVRALPPRGAPDHHWELMAPFRADESPGPVLLVLRDRGGAPDWPCADTPDLSHHTAVPGFAGGKRHTAALIADPACVPLQRGRP